MIADCCSRDFSLSDADFLTQMNMAFPVQPSWQLVLPPNKSRVRHELQLIRNSVRDGINRGRQQSNDSTWLLWEQFCVDLHCDPELQNLSDPIPLLQLFAHRYRVGSVAPSGSPVRSRTVEGALRAVGQAFSTLRCPDPRLLPNGKLDYRLSRQLSAYAKQDPPPSRVKPIPLPVIGYAADMCQLANMPYSSAISDMLLLGFFFLLRPGEYAYTQNPDACPFHICDIHLLVTDKRLHPYTTPEAELNNVNFVTLEFTNQKNGVRGEMIGLGHSGHPIWCPVQAILSRIRHFRIHQAPMTTPLYKYFDACWRAIDTNALTNQLRLTIRTIGHHYGLTPQDITVRSLRASGAMALLCARVDTDTIRLLGGWKSDEMLRYLHVQSYTIVAPLAAQMLHRGSYSLIPNQHIMG
jgi:hypothetical protein